jgi:hypothetical protein
MSSRGCGFLPGRDEPPGMAFPGARRAAARHKRRSLIVTIVTVESIRTRSDPDRRIDRSRADPRACQNRARSFPSNP